ncbi:MAG TPA: DUF4388 domain-containing protein [Candidatus Obscuribacterales bacterium]
MFRPPKPPPPPPPIRLPKLKMLPSYDHVAEMLTQAQHSRGRLVELVFETANPSTERMLAVKCSSTDDSDPIWTFYSAYSDGKSASDPSWSYPSPDVALIHNIVTRECTGGPIEESEAQLTTLSGFKHQVPTGEELAAAFRQAGDVIPGQNQASLQGDLANFQVPKLLLSIAMSELTGRLFVDSTQGGAEVFFENGRPLHADALDQQGDMAIVELMTWQTGRFQFHDNERTTLRTVYQQLEVLVRHGTPLREQARELAQLGLKMESYLIRRMPNLTEAEFERAVARGIPLDMNMQKILYQCIDNQSTVFDILRRHPMPKTDWLPVLYNLLKCEVIVLSDKPAQVHKPLPLEAMGLDRKVIQAGMKNLMRPETDLINYPLILYFVEQEYFRYEASGLPFSVIVFEMALRKPDGTEPLPIPHIKEVAKRIGLVTRRIDLLAHFETFAFLLLLPYTPVSSAAVVANRIVQSVLSTNLIELEPQFVAMAMGIAGLPEDCQDMGVLLAGAKEAKRRAQQGSSPIVLFRDLRV